MSVDALGVGAQRLGVVGLDVARRDGVDVDALRRPFVGEELRQAGDAAAWRRCRTATRMPPWKDSSEAMLTILPAARAAKAPPGEGLASRKNSVFRLTSITSSQSALGEVDRVGAADDAGIVDEDVDRTVRVPCRVEHRGDGCGSSRSSRDRVDRAAGLRDQRVGLVHRRAADARAPRAPAAASDERDALADAGVGAGDQRAPAVEAERGRSSQVAHRHHVDIVVVDIVAGHRPDEGVVRRCRRPNGSTSRATGSPPRWRPPDGASRPARPSGGRRARRRAGRNRDRPPMRRSWTWHGMVFQTEPGRQLGHADDQLAGLQHVGMDELEDRALVATSLARRGRGAWRRRCVTSRSG